MHVTEQQRCLLAQGCAELGLALSSAQQQKINAYLDGLVKWNKAYNLTAIRDPGEMVIKHLLDSLAIYRAVEGDNVLDVGTGPGLPGIPLAILYPQRRFTLLDSNGKKTRFLVQMKHELQLDNVGIINDRIESFGVDGQFDCVTCRAFSCLQDFVTYCLRLVRPSGALVAMKGRIPENEIAALDHSKVALTIDKLTVPYLNDERHLIRITRK